MKKKVAVILTVFTLALGGGVAVASHSPGGDQLPGRDRLWSERPFFGTNEPPLGSINLWVVGWRDSGIGPQTSVRFLDLGNGTFDVSGEGTFGGSSGRRIISVLYNNTTCTLGANREGHIAHFEWIQSHPAVGDTFRHVGGNGLKGYRILHPLSNIKAVSIRAFNPGGDFVETEANTTKLACYDVANGRTVKMP
jgi:hypothetical protein